MGIDDFGGQMLPIGWCAPQIGLFCSTCCWKKFLASGDPPGCLWKNLKNEKFSLKKMKKWLFSILGNQNRLTEGWGGPVRLFGLPWGFTPNRCLSPQKKISDQAHPHHRKNWPSKSAKMVFFFEKKSNFRKCCRNFCGEGCRNFWHFGGTLQYPIFAETKSWRFLIFIRGVVNFWKSKKLIRFL